MSDICRLCLSFSTENMRPLTECEGILYNVVSFQITENNVLPNHICALCFNKLIDCNDFCLQVQKNQENLHKELNKGENALNNFYEQIKNQIKQETSDLIHENKETIDNVNENDFLFSKIKTEDDLNPDCDVEFDSEDDIPLLKRDINIEDTQSINNTKKDIEANYPHNIFNFKCLTCFETFNSQNKLLNHYNNVHKVKEEMKGKRYTQIENDGKILYKCYKCDKVYDNVRSVNKHAKTHCDEKFHCKVCGRTYKTVSEIIRHGRAHNGAKISCSFGCGFATVYSGALKSHERRHREEFKYKCETCGKCFQVKTWYEQHQNIHTGAKPYVCDICNMAFHMDRYLKAHLSAVHADVSSKKRYVCVHCGHPCGNMKALTRHLKEHGITSSVLCDLCGKTLSSSDQLAIHRRLHTGVKPYSCSVCNKVFAKRSNLKLHAITHSGARAHACAACGRRYSQRSALLRHRRRHHSSEKKCPKCEATFTSQAELGAHLKICSS